MAATRLVVRGGGKPVRSALVVAPVAEGSAEFAPFPLLRDNRSGALLPAQWLRRDGSSSLLFLIDQLAAGEERHYSLVEVPQPGSPRVQAVAGDGQVRFLVDGTPFTVYHCEQEVARPYLYPIRGPGVSSVTRGYPMDPAEGETQDHPHHRSLWVAFGDVNGTDNWSEEPGHAWIRALSVEPFQGQVSAGLRARHLWTTHEGAPVLREDRELALTPLSEGEWMLDLVSCYRTDYGPVRLGDTKEGGLISVRVATPLDAARGGRIENSEGGVNEGETWGKPAAWCDYSGTLDGHPVGIALMDHPANPRFPTYWHVRDYGLMTANPFGLSHYFGSPDRDGSLTLPAGQATTFRYRAFIHAGDARSAEVHQVFRGFADPPLAEWPEVR